MIDNIEIGLMRVLCIVPHTLYNKQICLVVTENSDTAFENNKSSDKDTGIFYSAGIPYGT